MGYPGRRLWCGDGQRVEVSGTYHDGSDLLPGYHVIMLMKYTAFDRAFSPK